MCAALTRGRESNYGVVFLLRQIRIAARTSKEAYAKGDRSEEKREEAVLGIAASSTKDSCDVASLIFHFLGEFSKPGNTERGNIDLVIQSTESKTPQKATLAITNASVSKILARIGFAIRRKTSV